MRILIVEDERKVAQFIKRRLEEVDYSATVVRTCAEASDALAESPYDAIILDLGLPDGDGLTLLKEWRGNRFNEPVLIPSARDAVDDRVKGLNLGADDYLPKPFSMEEMLARIRSLLRRNVEKKTTVFEHRGIRLDLLARTVTLNGRLVDLTGREFALLELFMQNQGRVMTRTLIAEKIWDTHDEIDPNLLDVYMRRLRKKLAASPDEQLFKTLRGVGYQMI
jgi:DNA-binding response OmpR family regulator